MAKKQKKCKNCGKLFTPKGHEVCCSKECVRQARAKNRKTYDKACVICGEHFEATYAQQKFCSKEHHRNCVVCGHDFIVDTSNGRKAAVRTCSTKCAATLSHAGGKDKKARRRNSQEKYGVDNPFQSDEVKAKIKKTFEENPDKNYQFGTENFKKLIKDKYDVDNVSQLDDVKEKKKATSREHYGTDYHMQSKEVPDAMKQTSIVRYGVETALLLEENQRKAREGSKEKYGTDYPMQSPKCWKELKRKNQEKYGKDWYTQTDEYKEKAMATNREKYGVDWSLQAPEVKDKINATMIDRYGVENPFSSPEIQARIRETLIDEYGVDNVSKVPEIQQRKSETIAERAANDPDYMSHHRISKLNRDIAEKLNNDLNCDIHFEPSIGNGMNADIECILNDRRVIIDINPTITHNMDVPFQCILNSCTQPCGEHKPVSRDYHYQRAMSALYSLNTPYLQFYDWDSYETMRALVASHIMPITGKLSAHDCNVAKVESSDINAFLRENHVQGDVRGQSACYALMHAGEIIAVASFGKPRYNANYEWEWLRYAVRRDLIIRGAAVKLFNAFNDNMHPSSVISYVDFDHSTMRDSFMRSCGFIELEPTGASVCWSQPGSLNHVRNSSLIRQGADRLLGTHYGNMDACGLTNNQIMMLEGYLRVGTSGNRVFSWQQKL